MPPKKDVKKQAAAKPDNSGIPKNDIEFKFVFTINSDQLPQNIIMFQWFGPTSDKIQRFQTGIIQSWQKGQKKFTFEKSFDLIRVQDDFCKTITTKRFFIYFINPDDNKVQDMLLLDYSSLLMAKDAQPTYTYESNTIKIMDIDQFSIKITADKQLLQQTYRHYLNPFQVEVIGAKDVPIDNSSKYQPTYIKYCFFDGNIGLTHSVVGNGKLLWNHKHVFLSGLMDQAQLKQKIRSRYMKFELHDRDQIHNTKIKEDIEIFDVSKAIAEEMEKEKPIQQDPKKKGAKKQQKKQPPKKQAKKDAKKKDVKLGEPILPQKIQTLKNNYGVAGFYLIDFIKPTMKSARYKAPVVPRNTFQDFESKNIDLNTTARGQMQKILSTNNYFELDTILVVSFTLSYPIGTFVKPKPVQEVIEDTKKNKKDGKPPVSIEKEKQLVVEPSATQPKDVFERVVYIFPYKSPENVQKIEEIFYQNNMKIFSLSNQRELSTFLLNSEQKNSKTLDYLTAIQIIDSEARIYIIQGLREGAMKSLHAVMPKITSNTKNNKILKNSQITFLNRLYQDFNIQIKKIRLRPSLSQILLDPTIYIKSKVAEQICQNINRINDIKKLCDDLKSVDAMNLWPASQWLIQIQRKYSQSVSYEDINGVEEPPKTKGKGLTQSKLSKSPNMKFLENSELKFVQNVKQFSLPKIDNQRKNFSQTLPNLTKHTEGQKKNVLTKTFKKDNTKMIDSYTMRMPQANIPDSEPVYVYAGQKNNHYQRQMKQIRAKIQANPNTIFTYSKQYLSGTIDPKNLQQEIKRQLEVSKSKMISKKPFSSIIIKTKEQRMKLAKKPTDEDIKELQQYPYHQSKALAQQMKKNTRDIPLNSGKEQFEKYLRKNQYFSQPEVIEGQKISPIQRFKMEQEENKKRNEQFNKKLKGKPFIQIKKAAYSDKATGIDRFKDIRHGDALKLGFIDVHKPTKQKRPIKQLQVSLFLQQDKIDPSFNPLVRVDNPIDNIDKLEFNNYQRPEILTFTSISKPLKDN